MVGTSTTVDDDVLAVHDHQVAPGTPGDNIATVRMDGVSPWTGRKAVWTARGSQARTTAIEQVGTSTTVQHVASAPPTEHVGTSPADETVVATAAGEVVGT